MQEKLDHMEKNIDKMAQSIDKIVETLSAMRVIEEQTSRNAEEIMSLKRLVEKKEESVRLACSEKSDKGFRRSDDLRKLISAMDEKMNQRGDARLKWGLGIALMTTFTLFGTSIAMTQSLQSSMEQQSKQNYYTQKKMEELTVIIETIHSRKQ